MAVQDWWCPVCGWWWAITEADSTIKAVGSCGDLDQLVTLDIADWVAAPSSAGPRP